MAATNLYLVTCAHKGAGDVKTIDVYVLAASESDAAGKALEAIHAANYLFTDYVKSVALVAMPDKHKGPAWLIGTV